MTHDKLLTRGLGKSGTAADARARASGRGAVRAHEVKVPSRPFNGGQHTRWNGQTRKIVVAVDIPSDGNNEQKKQVMGPQRIKELKETETRADLTTTRREGACNH